jgi:hypothetical protein
MSFSLRKRSKHDLVCCGLHAEVDMTEPVANEVAHHVRRALDAALDIIKGGGEITDVDSILDIVDDLRELLAAAEIAQARP